MRLNMWQIKDHFKNILIFIKDIVKQKKKKKKKKKKRRVCV